VSLGMNIMEQEVIDMTNTIARNGLVFFPDFCQIVLKKFREDDEEQFAQVMFKVNMRIKQSMNLQFQMFCGTDPLPELFRAKKYKIKQKFLTKSEFHFIMKNLPVEVSDDDIEDMFSVADTDNDGKLGYQVHFVHI
jgi:Ca2+-binding EF-hand superfamily protein